MFKTGTSLKRGLKLLPAAGAIAGVVALGGSALSQEAPGKDEVFAATSLVTGISGNIISFDISFVDPTINRYLLADRTNAQVEIVSTTSNAVVFTIKPTGTDAFAGNVACNPAAGANDCKGPNGVLTTHDTGSTEVWVGDGPPAGTVGGISTVKVFSLSNSTPSHTISTGGTKRADEGCFDPKDHIVLMANDAETPWPFISFIATGGYSVSADRYTVLKKITMDGTGGAPKATNGIEQCQYSGRTGKFYLNIPEVGTAPGTPGDDSVAGAVLVINPTTMSIEKTFSIDHDACAGPQGMAIGPSNQILLGCNAPSGGSTTSNGNGNFSTVIINERSGAITRVLDNESGSDEVWFNPGDGHYFLARSSAAGPAAMSDQLLGVVDSSGKREDMSIPTAAASKSLTAHSVAADPNKNQVYVPIPAGGQLAGGGICSSQGGSDADGCIAVFTVTTGKDDKVARQRGQDDKQE
jgi:hypothetical protein